MLVWFRVKLFFALAVVSVFLYLNDPDCFPVLGIEAVVSWVRGMLLIYFLCGPGHEQSD